MNMDNIDKDMDEIIAIVDELESIDKPSPLMFGIPIEKVFEKGLDQLDDELSRQYYSTKLTGTKIKSLRIGSPTQTFHVLEIIFRQGCERPPEMIKGFKGAVSFFADMFGLNVEFTKK